MKAISTLIAASVCALAAFASPLAHASLVNNNNGTFTDTDTGYVWRTLAQYDGLDYATAKNLLPTGFHVASAAELGTLTSHAPAGPANYDALVAAMGAVPDTGTIWAYYGDGTTWLWDDGYSPKWFTNAASNAYGWNSDYPYAGDPTYTQTGLSLFAVSTTVQQAQGGSVPEPGSLAMVGLGLVLAGRAARRRRK
jgi:hypothetical protein